jgi:hypothetical protein
VRTTLAALVTLICTIEAAGAAAPPVVDWRGAGDHTGQVVTVEGDVRSAQCAEDTCALEFAPDDATGFRVVVLMPMFSRATEQPDRIYAGRRIRATGKVQRFQGRVEMVVRGTAQIELADVTSTTATVAAPTTPRPTPPPSTLPPPAPAPRGVPSAPPPPVTTAAPAAPAVPAQQPTPTLPPPAPTPPSAPVEAAPPPRPAREELQAAPGVSCEQAKARWRQIAGDVKAEAAALARCFRALPYHCRAESAALAALLPALDEAERQADVACR